MEEHDLWPDYDRHGPAQHRPGEWAAALEDYDGGDRDDTVGLDEALATRPEMTEAEKRVMRRLESWKTAEEDRCHGGTCVPTVDAAADERAYESGLDLEEAKRVMEAHDMWPADEWRSALRDYERSRGLSRDFGRWPQ